MYFIFRAMIELKGFYSLEKPGDFHNLVDVQVIYCLIKSVLTNDCLQYMSAMIHPGGGRNDVPQRFKRHFITFNCTIPTDDAIDHIFGTIAQVNKETTKTNHFHFLLKGHFNANRGFSDDVANLMQLLVPMTRKMWKITKEKMLPTPSKFHYVFNLRDLSRIWLGMLGVTSQVCTNILSKLPFARNMRLHHFIQVVNTAEIALKLWRHEVTRILSDRFSAKGI